MIHEPLYSLFPAIEAVWNLFLGNFCTLAPLCKECIEETEWIGPDGALHFSRSFFFPRCYFFLCLCVFLILCDKGSQSILSSSLSSLFLVCVLDEVGCVPAFVSLPGSPHCHLFLVFFSNQTHLFGWLNGRWRCSRPLPPLSLLVFCLCGVCCSSQQLFFPTLHPTCSLFFHVFLPRFSTKKQTHYTLRQQTNKQITNENEKKQTKNARPESFLRLPPLLPSQSMHIT
ncbi:MAG: hypothetical protein JOS17DRAFT_434631 [Linnemannia elongata]|nr:MAG: hypothetical protein JOS17DRAFT_434631 [Linnemannia elongata]